MSTPNTSAAPATRFFAVHHLDYKSYGSVPFIYGQNNLETFVASLSNCCDHYFLVAIVKAEDLGDVYELTNTIENPWVLNAGVYPAPSLLYPAPPLLAAGGARSTSVGDIIVDTLTNDAYLVAPAGFHSIGQSPFKE